MADTQPTAEPKKEVVAPSIQEKATAVAGQATQQAKEAAEKAKQAMGQVQDAGKQVTQAAGQATVMAGQAGQLLGQAKDLLTSKPSQPQPPVAGDEKVWAALSYIPMVALVAFLIKPKSEFVKLHGRQGLLLFLISFFSVFLYIILPPLGAMFGGLLQFATFVVGIFSIYQALMGNWWKTPVLGQIADKLPVEMFTNVATQAITGQEPTVNAGEQPPTPPPAA